MRLKHPTFVVKPKRTRIRNPHSGLSLVHVIKFDQILIKFVFVLFCILFVCATYHEICTTYRTVDAYLWLCFNVIWLEIQNKSCMYWVDCSAGHTRFQPLCSWETKWIPRNIHRRKGNSKCQILVKDLDPNKFTHSQIIIKYWELISSSEIIKQRLLIHCTLIFLGALSGWHQPELTSVKFLLLRRVK